MRIEDTTVNTQPYNPAEIYGLNQNQSGLRASDVPTSTLSAALDAGYLAISEYHKASVLTPAGVGFGTTTVNLDKHNYIGIPTVLIFVTPTFPGSTKFPVPYFALQGGVGTPITIGRVVSYTVTDYSITVTNTDSLVSGTDRTDQLDIYVLDPKVIKT